MRLSEPKMDYGVEIAHVRIFQFNSDTEISAGLAHVVLDAEGGAKHMLPELRAAHSTWLHMIKDGMPANIVACIVNTHGAAYSPREWRDEWRRTKSGQPHWQYSIYPIKRDNIYKWDVAVDASRGHEALVNVARRRNIRSFMTSSAAALLEGRVSRLLYGI